MPPRGTSQAGQWRDKTEQGADPMASNGRWDPPPGAGAGEGSDRGVRGCGSSFSGERQTPRSRGSPLTLHPLETERSQFPVPPLPHDAAPRWAGGSRGALRAWG